MKNKIYIYIACSSSYLSMNMRQYFQLTQYSLQSPTVKILVQNRQNLKAKKKYFFSPCHSIRCLHLRDACKVSW